MKKKVYLSKSKACDTGLADDVESHLRYMANFYDMEVVTFGGGTWTTADSEKIEECDVIIMVGPKKDIETNEDLQMFVLGKGQFDIARNTSVDTYMVEGSDGCSTGLRYACSFDEYPTHTSNYQTKYGYTWTEGPEGVSYGSDLDTYELSSVIDDLFEPIESAEARRKQKIYEDSRELLSWSQPSPNIHIGTSGSVLVKGVDSYQYKVTAVNGKVVPMLATSLL